MADERLDSGLFGGAMAALVEGALAFRRREYRAGGLMPRLALGQRPPVLAVACSDSRTDLAPICGARPGDIFTLRNVANLVPPYGDGPGHSVRAGLEYGVKALGVADIVVFGHARCGGIQAAIDIACGEAPAFDCVGPWVAAALPACRRVLAGLGADGRAGRAGLRAAAAVVERQAILDSLAHLRGYPWIGERLADGRLAVHGWWFDIDSGRLWATHPQTGAFLPFEGA